MLNAVKTRKMCISRRMQERSAKVQDDGTLFNRVIQVHLTDKVRSKVSLEKGEAASQPIVWGKKIPVRGDS